LMEKAKQQPPLSLRQPVSPVLSTVEVVSRLAKHVSIQYTALKDAAKLLNEKRAEGSFSLCTWRANELNPKECNEAALQWIFVVDCLNFCFWGTSDTLFTVEYLGKKYTGYWSLCAAINRALHEGIPILSAEYMANITLSQLQSIFRSATSEEVPLLSQRLEVIREAGQVLLSKFEGHFVNCIRAAGGSAQKLVELIVSNFSSFDDYATYQGKRGKCQS